MNGRVPTPSCLPVGAHSGLFRRVAVDLLRAGIGVRFQATGPSMGPTIREGEAITVRPVDPSAVRPGDIVLHETERGLIAHRVVRIDNAREGICVFTLRGDASVTGEDPVGGERILGKVVAVERGGRSIRLDTAWAKLRRAVRARASRLKRFLVGADSRRNR